MANWRTPEDCLMEPTRDGFRPGHRAFEITGDFFTGIWNRFVRVHPLITALALRQLWLGILNRQDFIALLELNTRESLAIMQLHADRNTWQFLTRLATSAIHYGDTSLIISLLHSVGWQQRCTGSQTLDEAIALNLWPGIRATPLWRPLSENGLSQDSLELLRLGRRVEARVASLNAASPGKAPDIDRRSYQKVLKAITSQASLAELLNIIDAPETITAPLAIMTSEALRDTHQRIEAAPRIDKLTTLPSDLRPQLAHDARLGMAAVLRISRQEQTCLACFRKQPFAEWSLDDLFQLQLLTPKASDSAHGGEAITIAEDLAGKLTDRPITARTSGQATIAKQPTRITTLLFAP